MDARKLTMPQRFFTADHHFGHTNILKYEAENRRFRSVEKMDDHLVDQWNEVVQPEDVVYHLGDLAFKRQNIEAVMPFLNGRKILIAGNHDPFFKELWKGNEAEVRALAQSMGFEDLHTRLTVRIEGIGDVLLSHFPYLPEDLKNEPGRARRHLQCHPTPGQEALLLHGHVHSRWLIKHEQGKVMINVGVDAWGLRPVAEAEIQRRFAVSLLTEES